VRRRTTRGPRLPEPARLAALTSVAIAALVAIPSAWAQADFCHADQLFHVYRLDLATGRSLRGQPTGTSSCPRSQPSCGDVGIGRATALVLDSRASVAWIAGDNGTTEVWRLDGRRRLASGPDIDARSLRRRHRSIEWRQGGTVHRASLGP
jgi:hypothetical protein